MAQKIGFFLTGGWTSKGLCDVNHINNNGLDSISFSLDLGQKLGHFVAIKHIADASIYVETHFDDIYWKFNNSMKWKM